MPGQYSLASAAIARQGTLRRLWVPQLDCLATNMGTEIDCRLNRFKVGTKCPPCSKEHSRAVADFTITAQFKAHVTISKLYLCLK